tara:strand:+ start:6459 stop:7217 length:759 start_codon:yes stop_codon:yes gene_type:complete
MIILDEFEFAYVHIPKCGGTSVKSSNLYHGLSAVDNGHDQMSHHVPLAHIKATDPELYQKVCNYNSFAHVREPLARFRSALFQHCREFLELSSSECDDASLLHVAYSVAEELENADFPYPIKYEHFTPQYSYLEVDGECIIKHIGVLGDFTELNAFYSKGGFNTVGVSLNVTYTPKKGLFSCLAKLVQPFVRTLLPSEFKNKIWMWLISKGLYEASKENSTDFLLNDPKIISFIRSFYARDFELYEKFSRLR